MYKLVYHYLFGGQPTPDDLLERLELKGIKNLIIYFLKGASYATYLYQVDERWVGRSGSILFCNTLCDEDKKDAGEILGPILIFANPNPVDVNYMQVQVIPDSLEAAKLHDGVLPDILILKEVL